MKRGPSFEKNRFEKKKIKKDTFKKFMNYLKPYRVSMILVVIFAVISSVFTIIGPDLLGKATTKIFEGLVSKTTNQDLGIDFSYIFDILVKLAILYILSTVFTFMKSFMTSSISQKVSYNLRKEISEKINKLPLSYFDKVSNGEVLSRMVNDVDSISTNLEQILSQIITSVTTIIGITIMMLSISLTMTIGSLIVIPLSMMFIVFVVKKSQIHFINQQKYLGKVNSCVEEIYSGHNVVKVFNREEKEINEFEKLNETLYESAWKSQFLSSLMMPVMSFIGNIGYVVVAILGGYLAINNKITVGDIQAFIQYNKNFMQPLAQTSQIANIIQATMASAERVIEFLEEKEEIDDVKENINTSDILGNVSFKNVNFGYTKEKTIINDFSIDIKKGQKIAIVGPTGAGKTTIVKLLMRFYDVNSGEILIDGKNIKEFKRSDLRKLFGMVLQDTWLFNGSIMDNIRYGKLDATDEEVIKSSKVANAHHFISTLPNGYNMEINEEANNISQGQKQLLTIARVILANPKILILDEATSSIDTRTEVLIQSAIKNLMKDKTSFIIAHRLSTIKDADVILVMNEGDIIEVGNHEELLEKKGFYYNLYNSQFENN